MTYPWGRELSNPPRCWKRVNGCVEVDGGQVVVGLPALLDHPDDPTGSHLNPSESV
jgi:hypothetical protein